MVTSSDFKTIKAKVGKRAPVKANVTDTSFKSAGLHISKQIGISNTTGNNNTAVTAATASSNDTDGTTTRSGLSLHQLLTQFKHPTIAVRISALKSFKNLLLGHNISISQQHSILQSYISEIVSSLLPICCIDDEVNVRKLAIQTFYDVFLSSGTNASTSTTSVTSLVQPFTSYTIAMICTGLNSLDIQQQFDNAIMVRYFIDILSINHHDVIDSNQNSWIVMQAIVQFTPPLTRLLGVVPNTTTTSSSSSSPAAVATTNSGATSNLIKSLDTVTNAATGVTSTTTATNTTWVGGNGIYNASTTQQQQQHPMMIVGSMKKSKPQKKRKRHKVSSSSSSTEHHSSGVSIATTSTRTTLNQQQPTPPAASNNHSSGGSNGATGSMMITNPKLIVLTSIYTLFRNYYLSASVSSQYDNASLQYLRRTTNSGVSHLPDVTIQSQQLRRTALLFIKPKDQSQQSTASSAEGSMLTRSETLDLLAKVRDFMIEASQSNDSHSLLYCIMTVRFVMEYYNSSSRGDDMTSEKESVKIVNMRCVKLCSQIGSYIVESFRMYSSNNGHEAGTDSMAVLSRTLLCIINAIHPLKVALKDNSKQEKEISTNIKIWIQLITLHIQSTLEDDEATLLMESTEQQGIVTDEDLSSTETMTTKEMLSILTELLVRDDLRPFVTLRTRLIELFGAVFFLNDEIDETIQIENQQRSPASSKLICSLIGRTAIVLCCRLVSIQQYNIEQIIQFFGPVNTSKLLRSISYYIVHLKANYLTESTLCLSTLHQLVVRIDHHKDDNSIENNCYADMMPTLRVHIQSLLTVDESGSNACCSTFELYPEALQRQLLCFCILSNICTASIIKRFANICARCYNNYNNGQTTKVRQKPNVVSVTMASFIVQTIHGIRKAMPMTVYIGFLIDSTGVMALLETGPATKKEEYIGIVLALNQGLRCTSSCFIGCGTKKVMPMLEPVFTLLLGNVMHDPTSIKCIIQARAVYCLMAIFCCDLQRSNVMDGQSQSIFHFTSSEFKAQVVSSIMNLMSTGVTHFYEIALGLSMDRWLSPIITVFTTEKPLLSLTLKNVLFTIPEFDSATQGRIMDVWLCVLKEQRVASMLQSEGGEAMADILNHSKFTDSEEQIPVIKRIFTELQIRCGRAL